MPFHRPRSARPDPQLTAHLAAREAPRVDALGDLASVCSVLVGHLTAASPMVRVPLPVTAAERDDLARQLERGALRADFPVVSTTAARLAADLRQLPCAAAGG